MPAVKPVIANLRLNRSLVDPNFAWAWGGLKRAYPMMSNLYDVVSGQRGTFGEALSVNMGWRMTDRGLAIGVDSAGGTRIVNLLDPQITGYPFTMAGLFRAGTADADRFMFDYATTATNDTNYALGSGGGIAWLVARNVTGFSPITGSTDIQGRLHFLVGVFRSPTDRELYVDGVSEATQSTNVPFTNQPDRVSLFRAGDSTPSNFSEGRVLLPTFWDRALSDSEIVALAVDPFGPFREDEDDLGFVAVAAEYLPLDQAHTPQHQVLMAS